MPRPSDRSGSRCLKRFDSCVLSTRRPPSVRTVSCELALILVRYKSPRATRGLMRSCSRRDQVGRLDNAPSRCAPQGAAARERPAWPAEFPVHQKPVARAAREHTNEEGEPALVPTGVVPSMHSFRYTVASRALLAGESVDEVAFDLNLCRHFAKARRGTRTQPLHYKWHVWVATARGY